jgi:hypothetical protein
MIRPVSGSPPAASVLGESPFFTGLTDTRVGQSAVSKSIGALIPLSLVYNEDGRAFVTPVFIASLQPPPRCRSVSHLQNPKGTSRTTKHIRPLIVFALISTPLHATPYFTPKPLPGAEIFFYHTTESVVSYTAGGLS